MQRVHLEICHNFQDKIHKDNQQARKPNDFTLKPTPQSLAELFAHFITYKH